MIEEIPTEFEGGLQGFLRPLAGIGGNGVGGIPGAAKLHAAEGQPGALQSGCKRVIKFRTATNAKLWQCHCQASSKSTMNWPGL